MIIDIDPGPYQGGAYASQLRTGGVITTNTALPYAQALAR